ncbi:hypothetical protein [Promicromonospora iranensis]|uniref:Uncharacterized protein n=1 Tax=Promicromonospora iranensis TaxID=1105144 RepID=A0ABU2CV68_9MICO|nr:hypothetical protein [Promicromonospora iranensis]MDR7385225.1 hypothetical protein [Promicromonospora iranensis]
MSRRRSRAVAPLLARAHEDAAQHLADHTLRDDLLAVADLWPDVAARRVNGSGGALTGMPSSGSDVHRMPVNLGAADVCTDIDREFTHLVLVLAMEHHVHLGARTPAGRLRQAAYEVWRLDPHERLDLRDTAATLRDRCEGVLGTTVRSDWLGPCPTPGCVEDVRLAQGRGTRTCPGCGAEHTRGEQELYIRECLEGRLMTLSELTSALVVSGMPTPYDTIRSWARWGRLVEHTELDWTIWPGIPFIPPPGNPTGLYPYVGGLDLALKRWHRAARVEGSAA